MNPVNLRTAQAEPSRDAPASGAGSGAQDPATAPGRFSRVLQPLLTAPVSEVRVQRGQTLTSIVREHWTAGGGAPQALSDAQAHRWALEVARDNRLSNPDRILPGQVLNIQAPRDLAMGRAPLPVVARPRVSEPVAPPASVASVASVTPPASVASGASIAPAAPAQPVLNGAQGLRHLVLDQTLDRAIARGYLPAADRPAVVHRIQNLADKHGFQPDDFARAVLMESDGFNPRASNGRCFGIIQFCNGPDRGAASAGFGRNAQEILRLSVLEQLDLVDRYFDDTRLGDFRRSGQPVRLDDLYLTILMPAARQERRLDAALPIPGQQALDLHAQRDRQLPITRQSILSGLYANARGRLGQLLMAHAGN